MRSVYTIVVGLASAALALPVSKLRATDLVAETDHLMFGIALPAFEARRDKRDPPQLDWFSDGCTKSPDNPFRFNFLPACHRHDFGYQNFRAQKRFTSEAKAKIDLNFRADLFFQCSKQRAHVQRACEALANVYYIAVKNFGGRDGRAWNLLNSQAELDQAMDVYREAVREAQNKGQLPTLPS